MKLKDNLKKNIHIAAAVLVITVNAIAAPSLFPVSAEDSGSEVQQTQQDANSGKETMESGSPDYSLIPENYDFVSEDGKAALYADMLYGDFAFVDKMGGKIWFSNPQDLSEDRISKGIKRAEVRSQLIVGYIDMNSEAVSSFESTVNTQSGSVSSDLVKVSEIDGGIRVEFDFLDQEFTIPVEYKITDGNLSAAIIIEDIDQRSSLKITSIRLLPYMTAAGVSAEGYMFVPQGSGAVIDLNNEKYLYSQYDQQVYGSDLGISMDEAPEITNNAIMPVFGIKVGDNALTGIITTGDTNAYISANVAGDRVGYNSVHSRLVMSIIDKTTLFETDYFNLRTIYKTEPGGRNIPKYEVVYHPSSGSEATYAGMARIYRDHLFESSQLKQEPKQPSLYVDLVGAIDKPASFLGIPYEKLHALTTFEQAIEISEDLRSMGVEDITMRLDGWTNHGYKNKKITDSASPLRVMGGKSGYKDLAEHMNENTDDLILNVDLFNFSKTGNSISKLRDAATTIFHTRVLRYDYMLSVFVPSLKTDPWFLIKPSSLPELADRFIGSAQKLDMTYVSLDFMGENIYSDFSAENTKREDSVSIYDKVLKKFADSGVGIITDTGNAYMYQYADRIFALPSMANGHLIIDDSVPFAQIVLHGYIGYSGEDMNRQPSTRDAFLRSMETGADLFYRGIYSDTDVLPDTNYQELYSYTFDIWGMEAARLYKEYAEVHKDLYDKEIVDHKRVDEKVFTSIYSDGTKITVNYSDHEYVAGGLRVGPKDYIVEGGAKG